VETGANAFVTLTMPDNSAISLPSQSRIRVVTLTEILLTGTLQRNFQLEAGRTRSSVTPMKDPSANYRVTTPLSVAAVRGTDFRVAIDDSGQQGLTEVVGGTVGVGGEKDADQIAVPHGYGSISTPAGVQPPIPLLPPPVLSAMERTSTGVAISAKPVDGAARYHVQLATDVGFRNVFDEATSDAPAASFALPDSATFFVRLTAIASSGMEGLPATYAPGRPAAAQDRSGDAGAVLPHPIEVSLNDHGRSQKPVSSTPAIR